MTNDVLEHLKAIKRELASSRLIVDECKKQCEEQTIIIEELKALVITQSEQLNKLSIEIQILKDGGNI